LINIRKILILGVLVMLLYLLFIKIYLVVLRGFWLMKTRFWKDFEFREVEWNEKMVRRVKG